MGGGGGGASCKLKKAAKKLFLQTCGGSFSQTQQTHIPHSSPPTTVTVPSDSAQNQRRNNSCKNFSSEIAGQGSSITSPNKNLCTICLDPLNSSSNDAVFTAQCSHAFHFGCISSNVRHGSVTCPICRAHWTQLPRNLNTRCYLHNKTDPVLRILDDSIANSRVHRRSFMRSARYDDDDPIEPTDHTSGEPRLSFSLIPLPLALEHLPSTVQTPILCSPNNRACLRVKLGHQPAIDLVLIASPKGPHLRLMKQAMAFVVFSLRPTDRLAIVTYSSAAARISPLRRMTSYGKRSALQVIDRVFYMGRADPIEGLRKGVKILEDRTHTNPRSCILHLTDSPARSYAHEPTVLHPSPHWFDAEAPVMIHQFNVGLGLGASNGFIMHEFEEFLSRTLSGGVEDIQLRIGEAANMTLRMRELRGGEERNIPLHIGRRGRVNVQYSYRDSGDGESIRTGEAVVGMEDKGENKDVVATGRRMSSAENLEYHDAFMARRWAKHLHGVG